MSSEHEPLMQDILDAFDRLAERVTISSSHRLDPFISSTLRKAMKALRRYIPGLEQVPDPEAARFLLRASYAAMEENDAREAMARAIRGLQYSPHHPGLWFVVATACFEYGAVEDAIRCLQHVVWIHPGYRAARRDLEALTSWAAEQHGEAWSEAADNSSEDRPDDRPTEDVDELEFTEFENDPPKDDDE
jgi:tetratricopeptide (TPR) repeat protein